MVLRRLVRSARNGLVSQKNTSQMQTILESPVSNTLSLLLSLPPSLPLSLPPPFLSYSHYAFSLSSPNGSRCENEGCCAWCLLPHCKEGGRERGREREGGGEKDNITSLPLYFIRILCSLKTTRTRTTDKLRYNYTILRKIRNYSQIIMVECV